MNNDVKRRDEIIWGEYNPKRYNMGGCCRLEMGADKFKQLIQEGFLDLYENQNNSPTTIEFQKYIEGCEDWVEFEAYAIGPERDDYRVTIEGINIWIPADQTEKLCEFVEAFRDADEFSVNTDENGFHLRAWWD